jgi:hypothetical protein
MKEKTILKKLRDDKHYYGDFGKRYLSNSDIGTLLTNPLALGTTIKPSPAFLVGGYFHTALLEPEKLKKYKVAKAASRNTKAYKETAGGELCLLESEIDKIKIMTDKILTNNICKDLIRNDHVIYEEPGVKKLEGEMWKGKADIINKKEKLIIDLKTCADINKFQWSAAKYNYDSQAHIYRQIFGYEMIFIVIDKTTFQIGIFDCSPEFYQRGTEKVKRAVEQYRLFFKSEGFDPQQFFINQTL